MTFTIHHGDSLEVLRTLPADSVDAVVTDPPYGLSFMGKRWDYDVPSVELWEECLRVLKPGGHLLAFAGTRTQHRMAVRIEDAGFEIRDMIAWVYGSGFPKSHDVSKAIDKAAGVEREVIGTMNLAGTARTLKGGNFNNPDADIRATTHNITAPATENAKRWEGWGTALKPALEPITVARKPFSGSVADNVLRHGTGGINIDGCRIGSGEGRASGGIRKGSMATNFAMKAQERPTGSRWPANIIHDGSDEVSEPLGSAARFFYCPKASKKDRDEGLDGSRNVHPTVKPTDLMRYLCRLVTPPGGTVLDPFMGSGSTGKAAVLEGFAFIGIEREEDYIKIAESRIQRAAMEVSK